MILPDYHMHSSFSIDSDTSMSELCEQAIKLGMTEIAFTDHVDIGAPLDGGFVIDFDAYMLHFLEIKEKYKKKLHVTLGVEVGLMEQVLEKSARLLNSYPFEFIIASTHVVDMLDLHAGDYCRGKTREQAYEGYLTNVLKMLTQFNDFSVCGHLDFVRRYGGYADNFFAEGEFISIIDEIFKVLIHKNKGIEINTSGYRCNLGSTLPTLWILKRFRELGGEIVTVGSDAHTTGYVGKYFEVATQMLVDAGFKYYTTFRNLQPTFVKID
ncbi:MAG: histidinol-phosphatase HisJ family protein [Hyphomonadaceae bacterium]|nr:histidinol-phosphatase HisJ family protein [Clostridia bacterium]